MWVKLHTINSLCILRDLPIPLNEFYFEVSLCRTYMKEVVFKQNPILDHFIDDNVLTTQVLSPSSSWLS